MNRIKVLAALLLSGCLTAAPVAAQQARQMARSTTAFGDSSLLVTSDTLTSKTTFVTKAVSLAQMRKSLSKFAFDSLVTTKMTLTGATVTGAHTLSGVVTFSSQPILSTLSASLPVFTDGSKGLVSNTMTGTGNVVMSTSPILTGTAVTASLSSSGTAALTTATATSLAVTGASVGALVATLTANDALTTTDLLRFERNGGAVRGVLRFDNSNKFQFGSTTAHNLDILVNNSIMATWSSTGLAMAQTAGDVQIGGEFYSGGASVGTGSNKGRIYTSTNSLGFDYGIDGDRIQAFNPVGYNGGTTRFRTIWIQNGRGYTIASFGATDSTFNVGSNVTIKAATGLISGVKATLTTDAVYSTAGDSSAATGGPALATVRFARSAIIASGATFDFTLPDGTVNFGFATITFQRTGAGTFGQNRTSQWLIGYDGTTTPTVLQIGTDLVNGTAANSTFTVAGLATQKIRVTYTGAFTGSVSIAYSGSSGAH